MILGLLTTKLLFNKATLCGALCIAFFISGMFFQRSCDSKKVLKQEVESLQEVIVNKERVRRHHEQVPNASVDDWLNILNGRSSLVCSPSAPPSP